MYYLRCNMVLSQKNGEKIKDKSAYFKKYIAFKVFSQYNIVHSYKKHIL